MIRSRGEKNGSNGDSLGACEQFRLSSSSTTAAEMKLSSSSKESSALHRKVVLQVGRRRKCSKCASASPSAHVWEVRLNTYCQYLSASHAAGSERRKDCQGLSASHAAGSKRRNGPTSALAASWPSSSVWIAAFMRPTSAYPRCTPDAEGSSRIRAGGGYVVAAPCVGGGVRRGVDATARYAGSTSERDVHADTIASGCPLVA